MVTADDLEAALSSMVATLTPAVDRDWSVRAGTLEWDCWHTPEHIGDCLLSYAYQIVARPATRYLRAMVSAEDDASPAGFAVLGCVETLLHGQDIARGLGLDLDPPRQVCARVRDRARRVMINWEYLCHGIEWVPTKGAGDGQHVSRAPGLVVATLTVRAVHAGR